MLDPYIADLLFRKVLENISKKACDGCDDPYKPYGVSEVKYWCAGCQAKWALKQAEQYTSENLFLELSAKLAKEYD